MINVKFTQVEKFKIIGKQIKQMEWKKSCNGGYNKMANKSRGHKQDLEIINM